MYCPSCGSNNQDEVRFCTRCGTNLDVVSDALRGSASGPVEADERMVKLLKDYYRSRRMTIIGGVASLVSLFKLSLLLVLGFPEKMLPLAALLSGLLLFGLFALIWGIIKWNNSSSEINALGYTPRKARALPPLPPQLRVQAEQSKAVSAAHRTDPIAIPASVTEHTTHFLDEKNPTPSLSQPEERH